MALELGGIVVRLTTTEETDDMKAYDRGFIDGLQAYAINKDGNQYVGSMGKTLKEAVKERKECWSYVPF